MERYAWFGAFREDDANEWTGDGVSLFDGHGKLTGLGAAYLGGEADGFEEGTGCQRKWCSGRKEVGCGVVCGGCDGCDDSVYMVIFDLWIWEIYPGVHV